MRILELFSGTKSWGKIADELGWEVVSLDVDGNADINMSILDWKYKEYEPGHFDIITASPPCHTFSGLRNCWIGREMKKLHPNQIITKEVLQKDINDFGLPLLHRALDIIYYFEPKYWFIENPGNSKMKNYLQGVPFYKVDYCMYTSWGYKKPTIIWTNLENFKPKRCNGNCRNTINGIHKSNIGGSAQIKGTSLLRKGTSLKERYRIPPELIRDLFCCVILND
tara:strand:- start:4101 stop:4772 length:672 start_codon:yes stop_codon:yes gene_type:complete